MSLEASILAGFAYGILKAVRKHQVVVEYAEVAEKAIRVGGEKSLPEGELSQTSFGIGIAGNLDFYREIPQTSMPDGQAMASRCLAAYLRKYF